MPRKNNYFGGMTGRSLVESTAGTPAIPQGSTSFDGSNDYIEVGAQAQNIDLSGAFTIEAWVRLNSTINNMKFFDLRSAAAALADTLLIDYSGGFRFFVGGSNQSSNPTATVNTWYHIAAVRDGSNNVSYFVNGSRVASTTSSLDFTLDYDFVMGVNGDDLYNNSNAGNPLDGFMSEARISNAARYDPTLTSISIPTAQFADDTNTLMLLRLNEATLSDVANSSRTITANGVSNSTSVYKFATVPAVAASTNVPTTGVFSLGALGGDGASTTRPTRRWGGMTGRSLVESEPVIKHSLQLDGTADYLSWSPSSNGSSSWTLSMWIKLGGAPSTLGDVTYFENSVSGADRTEVQVRSDGSVQYLATASGTGLRKQSVAGVVSANTWHHVVVSQTTTDATVYFDGAEISTLGTMQSNSTISAGNSRINKSAHVHTIGRRTWTTPDAFFTGQVAEVHFVDDDALNASYFGYTNNNSWEAKQVTGLTYGTNGFHLDFNDNNTATALGTDVSGAGNDWTVNSLATTDQLTDAPAAAPATTNVPTTGVLSLAEHYQSKL